MVGFDNTDVGLNGSKIVSANISKKDREGNTKKLTIKIGEEYIVNPSNPRKLKHRDRVGIVRSFKQNERNGCSFNISVVIKLL
ncbi:hypothetical protein [Carnobacterium jeotgali]|uniref:hypothetical protein n=1 Tax=Carnobacterium jeotgali TaxID=545534 RepID=UPI000492FB85|nr:hypothetical protein [Carnobacterium jeotgali]